MVLKYTLAWIPMIFIAVANGAARQYVYGPHMSELSAHQISCGTGIILFFLYTLMLARIMPLKTLRQAFWTGVIWLILTVMFEFSFGLFIAGHSLDKLLHDYDILSGRLWITVLFSLLVMPGIAFRMTTKKPGL